MCQSIVVLGQVVGEQPHRIELWAGTVSSEFAFKSEIEIAPVFHRLPDRIRAHALTCFLALLLYRVLRLRLKAKAKAKAKASPISPERALEIARRKVTLHQRQSASGLSARPPQQKELFETLALPEPSARRL